MTAVRPLKLAEAEIDSANAGKYRQIGPDTVREEWSEVMQEAQDACSEKCQQGRFHDCPMPDEFPPLGWRTALIAAVLIVAFIGFFAVAGV